MFQLNGVAAQYSGFCLTHDVKAYHSCRLVVSWRAERRAHEVGGGGVTESEPEATGSRVQPGDYFPTSRSMLTVIFALQLRLGRSARRGHSLENQIEANVTAKNHHWIKRDKLPSLGGQAVEMILDLPCLLARGEAETIGDYLVLS